MEQLLLKNGFYLDRRGGKHPIYTDGKTRIILPSGKSPNWRLGAALRSSIRRALEARTAQESGVPEALPEPIILEDLAETKVEGKVSSRRSRYEVVSRICEAVKKVKLPPSDTGRSTPLLPFLEEAGVSHSSFYNTVTSLRLHNDLTELFELQEAFSGIGVQCQPLNLAIADLERQTMPENMPQKELRRPQVEAVSPPRAATVLQSFDSPLEAPTLTRNQKACMEVCNVLLRLSPSERSAVLTAVDQFFNL